MPADWQFWQLFVKENPALRYVAVEFQTGNKNSVEGRKAIDRIADVQRQVQRALHPIIVGGGQFVEYAATRFDQFTLVDSTPFAKALRRQTFDRSAGERPWSQGFRLIGQDVDDFLSANIAGYAAWIEERVRTARAGRNR